MKAKFYLSDEGFGHIVRQRAIIESLRELAPKTEIHLQTQRFIEFAKENVAADIFHEKFNLMKWHKRETGIPDLSQIEKYYDNYLSMSDQYLKEEEANSVFDFYVSDFVYEAFDIAALHNKPSFGVAHFSWDWFFAKLYPPPLSRKVLRRFYSAAHKAKVLFFPPFTPPEILTHYKKNAMEIPFIIHSKSNRRLWPNSHGKIKILIMDSGAGLMKDRILKVFSNQNLKNDEWVFASSYDLGIENAIKIPQNHLLVDYVHDADLIIGRPGFNTISECITMKTPMLLISEFMNPEMEHNISELNKRRLGAYLSLDDFEYKLSASLKHFFDKEYENIKDTIMTYNTPSNGAQIVAETILNEIHV